MSMKNFPFFCGVPPWDTLNGIALNVMVLCIIVHSTCWWLWFPVYFFHFLNYSLKSISNQKFLEPLFAPLSSFSMNFELGKCLLLSDQCWKIQEPLLLHQVNHMQRKTVLQYSHRLFPKETLRGARLMVYPSLAAMDVRVSVPHASVQVLLWHSYCISRKTPPFLHWGVCHSCRCLVSVLHPCAVHTHPPLSRLQETNPYTFPAADLRNCTVSFWHCSAWKQQD